MTTPALSSSSAAARPLPKSASEPAALHGAGPGPADPTAFVLRRLSDGAQPGAPGDSFPPAGIAGSEAPMLKYLDRTGKNPPSSPGSGVSSSAGSASGRRAALVPRKPVQPDSHSPPAGKPGVSEEIRMMEPPRMVDAPRLDPASEAFRLHMMHKLDEDLLDDGQTLRINPLLAQKGGEASQPAPAVGSLTVKDLLKPGQDLLRLFKKFCKDSYSFENILFIQAVDDFGKQPSAEKAKAIWDRFLDEDAQECVNISYENRKPIAARIAALDPSADYAGVFDNARVEIEKLVDTDLLPRFVKSLQGDRK